MSRSSKPREYHSFSIGRSNFHVDVRYTNLKPIGSGSYGVVCCADDRLTGRQVAIKKITDVFHDLIDAKRILREIRLLHHLGRHDNVIELYDLMTYPPEDVNFQDIYMVTELYECDLDRILTSSQGLTDGHVQFFIYQILRALKWVHSAQVMHRDLKPLNLLVNANCDLSICDFGLARGFDKQEDTPDAEGGMTEYVVTRWYRAPELLCDNQNYDEKVDVWSVGCIFAEILLRKPVLKGKDYMQQLGLIIDLVGEPSREETDFIINPDARAAIRAMRPSRVAVPLRRKFSRFPQEAVDFLASMLVFDPRRRAGVEELLQHPYLASIHREDDEPTCPTPFNFDFEKEHGEEIPKGDLQQLMYDTMQELRHRDRRERKAARERAKASGK